MKKLAIISILACTSIALINPLLDARGGGGRGGGGGGRGGSRGGSAMNRSPSMSRAAQRPSAGTRDIQKPNRSQINNRIQQTPRDAHDFTRLNNQSNQQRMNDVIKDRTTKDASRNNLGDNVRKDIASQYPNRNDWFNDRFNHDHGLGDHIGEGNAWKWATWGALASWHNWGWSEPYYYDYGGYDDDNYVYADQAQTLASTSSQPAPSGESLSLGVFTMTSDGESDVTPNIYMHLSLDKNGDINGTIFNATTNKAYPLEGTVDKSNQRAAWMMANSENSPIIETGIYNLTQDQTPARVIFADGSTKNIVLVRVKQ